MATIELNPAVTNEERQAYVENHQQGLISYLPHWQELGNGLLVLSMEMLEKETIQS